MREFLDKWKRYLTFAAALSCFINLLQLTFPFYMFTIYRNVVVSYSEASLYTITVAAFYALLFLGFFSFCRSRLLAVAGRDLNQSLRETVYAGMIKGYAGLRKRSYLQGLSDLETVRNFCTNTGMFALFDAPWAPLYLLLIFAFHPVLGAIATAGALLMFGLSVLQEYLIRSRMRSANLRNNQNQRFVDAMLRNAEVVNGMGMLPAVAERWEQANRQVIVDQTVSSRYAGLMQSIIRPLQNFLQVLIYGTGAYYAMTQGFSVGLMVAAAIIMGRALAPVMQVTGTWKFTLQAKDAYRRLQDFLDAQEARDAKMDLPVPEGRIQVENCSLNVGGRRLLKGIAFSLDPGDFLAVIGPSGAGKTTLCRVLLGLWPSMGGKVRLDGVDIFYWDQESIGPSLGYAPQEIELFPGTVAQNIARMGPVDPEKVQKAALEAGIHETINGLPQGYATQLEVEGGFYLSGGQKQRLGLARAFYGDPRLLILDEPNSSLDDQGEAELIAALQAKRREHPFTCILVSHKPGMLQLADKILVLKNGGQSMFGPRQEVFSRLMKPQPAGSGPQRVVRA